MSEFMHVLRFLRKARGLTQKELAMALRISPAAVAMYEQGQRRPNFETEEKIARFFDVPLDKLRGLDEELGANTEIAVKIPILGKIAAGLPIEAHNEIIDYILLPKARADQGEFFALKIKGDSMDPNIQDGDIVLFKRQNDANEGDTVAVSVDNELATCKRLEKYSGGIMLVSDNAKYRPMNFSRKDANRVTILGKAVELRRNV